jgi:hypothetical protein
MFCDYAPEIVKVIKICSKPTAHLNDLTKWHAFTEVNFTNILALKQRGFCADNFWCF